MVFFLNINFRRLKEKGLYIKFLLYVCILYKKECSEMFRELKVEGVYEFWYF